MEYVRNPSQPIRYPKDPRRNPKESLRIPAGTLCKFQGNHVESLTIPWESLESLGFPQESFRIHEGTPLGIPEGPLKEYLKSLFRIPYGSLTHRIP